MTVRITEKFLFGTESINSNENPIKILDFEPDAKLPFVDGSNLTNLNINENTGSNNNYIATEVKNSNFTIEPNKFYIIIANNIVATLPATMPDFSIWGYLNFGNYTTTITIPAGQSIVNRLNATTSITTSLVLTSEKASKEFISYNVSGSLTHYSKFYIGKNSGFTFLDYFSQNSIMLKKLTVLASSSGNSPNKYSIIGSNYITDAISKPLLYISVNGSSTIYPNLTDCIYNFNASTTANSYTFPGAFVNFHLRILIPGKIFNFIILPPFTGSTNRSSSFTILRGTSTLTFEGATSISYTGSFVDHAYIRFICDGTSDLKILEASDGWVIN